MFGIDVSSWQIGIDFSTEKFDFAIMKATEGISFKDRCFETFTSQLIKLNKLTGCYHFARPDLNGTIAGMKKEAEWFVSVVDEAGLLGNAILVLDWETEPIQKEELIRAWLDEVVKLTGVKPFIYGSRSKLSTTLFRELGNEYPIWMAAWPSATTLWASNAEEWLKSNMASKTNVNWSIWQFKSTGKWNGFNGNVDFNYSDLTKEQWKELSTGIVNVPEIINSDMQWAIDMGLFIGGTNGKYSPQAYLTRDALATVLKRFYEKYVK